MQVQAEAAENLRKL